MHPRYQTNAPALATLRVELPDLREDAATELIATLQELIDAVDEHYRRQAARLYRQRRQQEALRWQRDLFAETDPPF